MNFEEETENQIEEIIKMERHIANMKRYVEPNNYKEVISSLYSLEQALFEDLKEIYRRPENN